MDLSLLQNLQVAKPERAKVSKYSTACEKGDFLITKQGAIFFSESFLQELSAGENGELKFLDMVDGRKMKFENGVQIPFLFVGILPYEAKVASIQGGDGKTSFVKNKLIPMLTELYNINWELNPNVEFSLLREHEVKPYNNIHYLPRVNKKGELKFVRRENIQLFPCVPATTIAYAESPEQPNEIVI